MNKTLMRSLLLLAALDISIAAAPAPAAPLVQLLRTINNPHPEERRDFGWSLDTFNRNLLVGSYGGSVYVINPNTGSELLRVQSPEQFGSFGRAITQFGDLIAVGAPELDFGPHVRVGSAYVFDGTTGAHLRTLRNPNPAIFGWFGFSMEEAAGKLFVSSESASGSTSGRVYVYGPNASTPSASLVNPQATVQSSHGFGFNMANYQDDLFVSAPGARTGGQETGMVYRYDGNTLALELSIANPNPESGTSFGRSLSTNAAQLLVGAPGLTINGVRSAGGAYLFDADSGGLLRTFLNPEPQEYAQFGESVALVGNFAVIGTPGYWPTFGRPPAAVGAAFVFNVNTGGLVAKIVSPSPRQNGQFTTGDGATLIAIGGRLAAGHAFHNEHTGAVYLFAVPEPEGVGFMFVTIGCVFAIRPCK